MARSTDEPTAWSRSDQERLRRTAERELRRDGAVRKPPGTDRRTLDHELSVYRVELEIQNRALARSEAELEKALVEARKLYDSAPVGYVTTDAHGVIVSANRTFARMLGLQSKVLEAAKLSAFVSPEHRELFDAQRQAATRSRRSQSCDVTLLRSDGTVRDVHLETAREAGVSGPRAGHHTVVVDVTRSRRSTFGLLAHSKNVTRLLRLRSVSEMASGLAHELSQPLQNIENFSRGCLDARPSAKRFGSIKQALSAILSQAEWAGRLVGRLRKFVGGSVERAPLDVNEIVEAVVSFTDPEARYRGMRVRTQLAPDLPRVRVDEVQIQQVLVNLLHNAFDAMSPYGARRREVTISTGAAGGFVELAVSDRGGGVRAADPAALFHSFYTTKDSGLGLGLTIARTIAEAHQGRLELDDRPGPGATFRLVLPAVRPRVRRGGARRKTARPAP